ncbi:hypothetical protein [Alkalitalea saponilacus]|uniref:Uncharacterized protein n=1 Tax=Alkalitalea saponilacus TaxID=889453 RepID=A0A1T5HSQ9_9BACT|nr:hypothetical protein [Alkalitalea saponilacus]ASB49253.1 hypothetical protein CDL62_08930 [Alkalitalea saponilacus]SKC23739.1 hypothetical protein SAMN03080601_03024 [Alkalitalea saponilacus]
MGDKILKLSVLVFLGLIMVGALITIYRNRYAVDTFSKLEFNGIVNSKTYIKNKKAHFVLIDSTWYGIMDYPLESYVAIGDSIYKTDRSKCIYVKRQDFKTKEFCNSYAYRINDRILIRNLGTVFKENREQAIRK